jgi:hypothetical protein
MTFSRIVEPHDDRRQNPRVLAQVRHLAQDALALPGKEFEIYSHRFADTAIIS